MTDADLDDALAALARGGVVAFPTETVWGLGVRLDRPDGVDRLRAVKRRPAGKPFQVLVADAASIGTVARPTAAALSAAARLVPGPVTLVLPARPGLPDLGGDAGTVGVRVPDHPVARRLLLEAGPLVATSANRSGEDTPASLDAVRAVFGAEVDAYLEGPPAPGGTPSTVIDLTSGDPVVLREGAVSRKDLDQRTGRDRRKW